MMVMDIKVIKELSKEYGNAFYILDTQQFENNYIELKNAFASIYKKFNIAYSYKTNYTPTLCRIVDKRGGLAEVVSDMELELALRIGVKPSAIIWNGPYKDPKKMTQFLLMGGTVNIDSAYELEIIRSIAAMYPTKQINVGIRCNYAINDGIMSRFGIDTTSTEFVDALHIVNSLCNVHFTGLQCHFASRDLSTWRPRAEGILMLLDKFNIVPESIDLGGGIFGKMPDSLKQQFNSRIPTYNEYAGEVATLIYRHYKDLNDRERPLLIIEPGSALVGDCMSFVSKIINIKQIRGKAIATILGSVFNINPTLNKKNPPISVCHTGSKSKHYDDIDFGGYTCIESDYIYRHFNGDVAQGDFVIFGNAGSYSIVLKPPFILPNFPIIDISNKCAKVIKRGECFDDLFHTFVF